MFQYFSFFIFHKVHTRFYNTIRLKIMFQPYCVVNINYLFLSKIHTSSCTSSFCSCSFFICLATASSLHKIIQHIVTVLIDNSNCSCFLSKSCNCLLQITICQTKPFHLFFIRKRLINFFCHDWFV